MRDTKVNDDKGKFIDWHLKLWGEAIDASKATVLPMPSDNDDDDHDAVATTTATAITTSLPPPPADTNTAINTALPTDHPERPIKPSKTPGSSAPTSTSTESSAAQTTTAASSWLPSFLPTFGVSSSTQAWIYGAIGLIAAFCCGLGAWFWFMRRKQRLNNPRDDYEFEPLNAEDGGDLDGGAEKNGQKRRGGELYDAFAGGSEDEDDGIGRDHFSIASSDDDDDDQEAEGQARTEKQGRRLLSGGR